MSCELINCLTCDCIRSFLKQRGLPIWAEQIEVYGSIYGEIKVCCICRSLGRWGFFLLIITISIKITFVVNMTIEMCCQVQTLSLMFVE